MHCICHLVNLCVNSAVKVLPFKVYEVLVDIYYHFHHSVKRITTLKEYADFCDVEFKSIIKRLFLINLIYISRQVKQQQFINFIQKVNACLKL